MRPAYFCRRVTPSPDRSCTPVSTESQSYTFNKYGEGSQQSSLDLGFVDQRTLSPAVTQGVNVSYTSNTNAYAGAATAIDSLHFNTLTHVTTKGLDYDLTIDKTDSDDPSGIDKLPELLIRPHGVLDPSFTALPITAQFAIGEYSEHQPQPIDAAGNTIRRARDAARTGASHVRPGVSAFFRQRLQRIGHRDARRLRHGR